MASNSPRFGHDASPTSPNSQRSGYPFPRSASTNRHYSRRGSNASVSSVGSLGSTADRQGRKGDAVLEISQNAISTLLQSPIVRTGLVPHTQASAAATGFKAPTTRDIPPVALTNIPHVPPETFQNYLARIGPLFDSFQRNRLDADPSPWLKKDKELEKTDRFAEALDKQLSSAPQSPKIARQTSTAVLSPAEKPPFSRRRSSGQYRRNRNEPTPLSTIPGVYFEADFHLENPRTFDVVSERAEIVRPAPGTPTKESKGVNGATLPPRKALATNAILQEKLSWYMDTVEVHLINNISAASTGFFAALGSLKELQVEAEESIEKIQSLRKDLHKLDEEIAIGGLEVAAKRRRRANVQKLAKATAQVQRVVEKVKKTDELVDQGSYEEAADQMVVIGRLVCGLPEPGSEGNDLIDLRPLKAMQGLDSGLQELQLRIGTGYAQRFTSVLLEDLRQHIQRVPPTDTMKRWSRQRGVPPVYMETNEKFRQDLLAALKGVQRAGHTTPATTAYREAVTKEMKSIIRRHLPSSNDDDADSMISTSTRGGGKLSQQEKSSILARNLRSLDDSDSEQLLVKVYTSVSEALRRVSTQTKVLLDVTSSMDAPELRPINPPHVPNTETRMPNGTTSPNLKPDLQQELSQALDMSSLIGQAVDTAQVQITRVLKVRNEKSVRLPKDRFLRYFTLNRLFADECEAVSGRGGQALKGLINAQISGFVQAFGAAETERIAYQLDHDDWNAVDFRESDEILLQRILQSMTTDPPAWSQTTSPIWEDAMADPAPTQVNGDSGSKNKNPSTSATNGAAPSKAPATSPAYIDETRFILVSSATSLLTTIDNILSLTSSMSSMTPAISAGLLEVLRAFNSRSSQLILGAGATRVAGLKNITTKHLALSSQALSFIVALTPYMRECARRHLPSGQTGVLAEFDRTKRLYQDHQSGIHDKLVDIMTSRSQAHVKSMSSISYSVPSATPSEKKPSPYMETLTKETLTLHRVLARHLNELDVSIIMRQIFASYKEQWTKAFGDVEVSGKEGEEKLLRDAECLDTRLGKIEGFGSIGKEVLDVVKAKIGHSNESNGDKENNEAKKENEGEGKV
nr:vacuolar protein sorting-associated protein 54 [Quercus suber]